MIENNKTPSPHDWVQVETILRCAKARAAALAGQVTVEEALAIYERAVQALNQASILPPRCLPPKQDRR